LQLARPPFLFLPRQHLREDLGFQLRRRVSSSGCLSDGVRSALSHMVVPPSAYISRAASSAAPGCSGSCLSATSRPIRLRPWRLGEGQRGEAIH
jgi:hypothetical protein